MSRDDPFGLSTDRERTRIRLINAPAKPPAFSAPQSAPVRRSRSNPNTLTNAFAALLEFAPELENAVAPDNPEVLRTRLYDELVRSRDAVVAGGSALSRADAAAWVVAALLDDLALNTPWGGASAWPRQPLVVMLRGDVDAGTQFFARLEELERHPNRDRDLLELQYQCLALGFRGKYRVPGRAGDRSLNSVRAAAAHFLRTPDSENAPLSPNWAGVNAAEGPRGLIVPIWVLGVMALVGATILYVTLSIWLSERAEQLDTLVRALPPPERPVINRIIPREAPVVAPVAVDFELLPEFRGAAPAELAQALKGRESVSLVTLIIQESNPEVFQSSRAQLSDGFEPLIASIAKVIVDNKEVIGKITVVGHTDSVPLQRTNPFSTNQRLSEARAQTISTILTQHGVPADSLHAEGRAASDPIADNGTREGRALNRRVEVLVEKRL